MAIYFKLLCYQFLYSHLFPFGENVFGLHKSLVQCYVFKNLKYEEGLGFNGVVIAARCIATF